jgi:CelD/BcsL family acetyltransferase involved in cellulose biosynthesis
LKSAYLKTYTKFSPGTVLLWFSLKYIIDNDRILSVDFQRGNERYKYFWGNEKETKVLIQIANPRNVKANIGFMIDKIRSKFRSAINQGKTN